ARGGRGAAARARAARRARAGLGGARVPLRPAGQRRRDPGTRADRGPPPDRAPDDRRQRGRRPAVAAATRAVPLPRTRAPRPPEHRAAGRTARLAGRTDSAYARAHDLSTGGRAGGRDLEARGSHGAPHRTRTHGARLARAALAEAGLLLAQQPRTRGSALCGVLPF